PCRNLTELGITLRAAFACHISSKPACTRCRVRVRLDGGNRKSHRKGLSSGGTNTSCPPILTRAEPVISQSTNRSTKCDVLYDLRVLRQPPSTCKSLYSHGGSHRFESCSAHHSNQSLTDHLGDRRCSRLLQLLRYVPQNIA